MAWHRKAALKKIWQRSSQRQRAMASDVINGG
jgi:hypothetical protein